MPDPFKVAKGEAVLEGILVDLNRETGRAESIKRIREYSDK
jgi:calcineurin-like phosphoesterase